MPSVAYVSPDWVMIGAAMPNGKVRLIASKDLNTAELQSEAEDRWGDPWDLRPFQPMPRYYLTASMRTYDRS